jgi:hypothetical protein
MLEKLFLKSEQRDWNASLRSLALRRYNVSECRDTEKIRRRMWRNIYERFKAKEVGRIGMEQECYEQW